MSPVLSSLRSYFRGHEYHQIFPSLDLLGRPFAAVALKFFSGTHIGFSRWNIMYVNSGKRLKHRLVRFQGKIVFLSGPFQILWWDRFRHCLPHPQRSEGGSRQTNVSRMSLWCVSVCSAKEGSMRGEPVFICCLSVLLHLNDAVPQLSSRSPSCLRRPSSVFFFFLSFSFGMWHGHQPPLEILGLFSATSAAVNSDYVCSAGWKKIIKNSYTWPIFSFFLLSSTSDMNSDSFIFYFFLGFLISRGPVSYVLLSRMLCNLSLNSRDAPRPHFPPQSPQ